MLMNLFPKALTEEPATSELKFADLNPKKVIDLLANRLKANALFKTRYHLFVSNKENTTDNSLKICARNANNVVIMVNGVGLFFKGRRYRAALTQDAQLKELIDLLAVNDRIGMF